MLAWVFLFSVLKKFDPFPSSFPSLFPSGVGFACRRRCRRCHRESTLSIVTTRLGLVLRDVPLGVPKAEKGGEGAARRRLSQVPGLPGERRKPGVTLCPHAAPMLLSLPHSCTEFTQCPPVLGGQGDAPQGKHPAWGQAEGWQNWGPCRVAPTTLLLYLPPISSPKFKFIPDYLMSGFRWQRDSSEPLLPLTLPSPTTHDQRAAGLSHRSWEHGTPTLSPLCLSFLRHSILPPWGGSWSASGHTCTGTGTVNLTGFGVQGP